MKGTELAQLETREFPNHHGLPTHAAEDLVAGNRQAIITLNDQPYTLHITKQGKLLLTK